jgi:hypothetical protein
MIVNFGWAIEELKKGNKVAREGWNGKGMWIALSNGYKNLEADKIWAKHNKQVAINNGGFVDINPYIAMKTADNKIQPGWNASQADMLAEDWHCVEDV